VEYPEHPTIKQLGGRVVDLLRHPTLPMSIGAPLILRLGTTGRASTRRLFVPATTTLTSWAGTSPTSATPFSQRPISLSSIRTGD